MKNAMYRLRSHVDDSLNLGFDCVEDMLAHIEANRVSSDDATMEEWIDDRINPANSGYRAIGD